MPRKPNRRKPKQSTTGRSSPVRRKGSTVNLLREALSCQQAGRLPEAERLYRKVLRREPHDPAALQNLGWLAMRSGQAEEAIALLRRSLAHTPQDPVCNNNLGNMLREQGRLDEAWQAYQAALKLQPDYGTALFNAGTILQRQDRHEDAEAYLRRAVEVAPDDPELWNLLGSSLAAQDKTDEAEQAFKTAIGLAPDYAEAHSQLGSLYMERGESESAVECFRRVTELRPEHADTQMFLARLRKFGPGDRDEIARVESMLARAGSEDAQVSLRFALGKMYDDCDLCDEAFAHYDAANRLRWRTAEFDAEARTRLASRTISTFTPEFFARRREGRSGSEVPVFVVGMPRSGTSLVEQIIASHPRAFGAGELRHTDQLASMLSAQLGRDYPECVEDVDENLTRRLATGYVEHLTGACPDAVRVTDKALSHVFHLGFLALLFPKARIIHCRRDPMDVAVSLYFQRFTPGTLEFSYDLHAIGVYYGLYCRLMRHWRETLPMPIHEVSYEALVADQETATRSLIDHCGLPWDDRCLAYFEAERTVRTASHWQVRQPIYKDSVKRSERYGDKLDALRLELEASQP